MGTDTKYILTSDSNQINSQFDSKKLSQMGLAEIAEDALFNKYITIMDKYLTNQKFKLFSGKLNFELDLINKMYQEVKDLQWSGKFKAVSGQVILVESNNIPSGKTPYEYVLERWDLPPNSKLVEIKNCMLRGNTEIKSTDVVGRQNQTISLLDSNIPPHSHHSAITINSNLTCLDVVSQPGQTNSSDKVTYDIFKNESVAIGLDKNEMDGVVDEFMVNPSGIQSDNVSHNNMPVYHQFYAFEVVQS